MRALPSALTDPPLIAALLIALLLTLLPLLSPSPLATRKPTPMEPAIPTATQPQPQLDERSRTSIPFTVV